MLKLPSSIIPNIFPVFLMMSIGGLLTSAGLRAQDNQWTKIPDPSIQDPAEPQAYIIVKPANPAIIGAAMAQASTPNSAADTQTSAVLPLWFYNIVSSRDNNGYFGVVVGNDPLNGGTAKIPTYIVPVIVRTNTVGVGFDPTTGVITTAPGVTIFDPTAADSSCMTAPNNVPLTVFRQSPIFHKTNFIFGGTNVGNTQYLDAFQRANFWNALQDQDNYHVLLNPVNALAPIVVNVPAAYGTTLAPLLPRCARYADRSQLWISTGWTVIVQCSPSGPDTPRRQFRQLADFSTL